MWELFSSLVPTALLFESIECECFRCDCETYDNTGEPSPIDQVAADVSVDAVGRAFGA